MPVGLIAAILYGAVCVFDVTSWTRLTCVARVSTASRAGLFLPSAWSSLVKLLTFDVVNKVDMCGTSFYCVISRPFSSFCRVFVGKEWTSMTAPWAAQLRSKLLLCLCDVLRALINSLVCWFCTSVLGGHSVLDYDNSLWGQHVYMCICVFICWARFLYLHTSESRGGCPGLPVPDNPYGLCGRKARLNQPILFEDVPLVEFMCLVFTRMPGESYRRRLRSLLLCLCDVFWVSAS